MSDELLDEPGWVCDRCGAEDKSVSASEAKGPPGWLSVEVFDDKLSTVLFLLACPACAGALMDALTVFQGVSPEEMALFHAGKIRWTKK